MNEKHTCCFCGKEFAGWGNNPDCWDNREFQEDERCCDDCDITVVIPARMKALRKSKEK